MLDFLLLLMIAIWGSNFSVIKVALREFPELPFNALRLLIAAGLLMTLLWWQAGWRRRRGRPEAVAFTPADWRRIVLLALVGHLIYQLCFLAGVARTSVANASLIFGCTPVMVAFLSSLAGHERIRALQWAGAALSLAGLYVLVGPGAEVGAATLAGDLLVFAGMTCWSLYSVLARPLLARHSPLAVTAWSMAIGAVLYGLAAVPSVRTTDWDAISALSWTLMTASAVFAIAIAFLIWYTGVQRIGSSRTAIYSNLTPIAAMIVAAVWLGEAVTAIQVAGASAILAGVVVTRRAA